MEVDDDSITHNCDQCSRTFSSYNGLQIHRGKSHKNSSQDRHRQDLRFLELHQRRNINPPTIIGEEGVVDQGVEIPTNEVVLPVGSAENTSIDPIAINDPITRANLPPYVPVNLKPAQAYNSNSGTDFVNLINIIYEEFITWRKNLFLLPSGQQGRKVITLLSEWLSFYNNNTTYQGIALKVFMVVPVIMLQKPSTKSKARDHVNALSRRMDLWQAGELIELLREGKIIQSKLASAKRKSPKDISQIFSRLMLLGKVSAALKFLNESSQNGVIPTSPEVIDLLKEKHPPAEPIQHGSLIQGPLYNKVDSIHFAVIDEQAILKAAMQTKGSCGPSHVDSDQYRRMLCSSHFKTEGKELREQMAIFARKLAIENLDPAPLEPYTSCRLIPLNKNPGVRPIGVGEVLRRIIGKTIAWSLREEVQEAAGPLQVASGIKGGAEAAIHAMSDIFHAEATDAVILVDASNAFNRLNRMAALHNIRYICHPFSQAIINTYRVPARLFITGGGEIKSLEGTTQGDPLAMQFYALGMNPLTLFLSTHVHEVKQVWLADDATGAGKLEKLKLWWDLVIQEGVKYGYFVNQSKSWLILKNHDQLEAAEEIFEGSHIKITTAGKRHLGAAIGSQDFKTEYITEKVAQ